MPFISGSRRRSLAERVIRELAVKTASAETPVEQLSGGNQQKVLIGRWLQSKPKALILDEPTRGVDVGARGEIHRLIRGLAQAGAAVMVVSSEPDELPDLCDRVLVMAEGRIVAELSGAALNRQGIVAASYASGARAEPFMSETSTASRRLSPARRIGLAIFARYATIIGLALMIAIFSILSPDAFPTFNNFVNVLNQASLATIIAGGLTLAVVVGELDLSIGYAASLHGVLVTGLIVHNKLPIAARHRHRSRAWRAYWGGQRADRHETQGQFGDRHARRRHDHRRPCLRLFLWRSHCRRGAGRLSSVVARALALRHTQSDHHYGGGRRGPLGPGRADGDRPGNSGRRR